MRALLSRAKVFVFEPITPEDISSSLKASKNRIAESFPNITVTDEAIDFLAGKTDGDLRFALSVLEQALVIKGSGNLTAADVLDSG